MRALLFVVSLAAVLTALPASAQLGPAGVPGAPGLAETDPSTKPGASASQNVAQPWQAQPADQKKPVKARKAKQKANDACKGKTGEERQQCRQEQKRRKDCSQSADPARCEQHKKAADLCKDKLGAEHRQCLHENLLPKN